jgi:hypothetical protein
MGDLSKYDLELWKFKGATRAHDKQTNAVATATVVAPGAEYRNRVVKIDASYSSSTVSGLLMLKSGVTVIAEKYIHGAGALDYSDFGIAALARNEAVSAELAAGGAAIVGTVTLSGFKHPDSPL